MRPKNDRKLGEILDTIYSGGNLGDKLAKKKIEAFWAKEMGGSITSRTDSIDFRHGVLRIKVSSAPLRQQLIFEKQTIIKRVEEAVPGIAIKEVKIY